MAEVHPTFRPYAQRILDWLKARDPSFHITSTKRSRAWQVEHHRLYLEGKWPFTVAPPDCSKHQNASPYSLAVDIASQRRSPFQDPYLHEIGRHWRKLGGEWGGEKDPIHFALPGKLCR